MNLRKYKFSRQIWVIIVGILLLRIGTTVTIPFLSIFLHFKIGLSLTLTGLIVGSAYLSYILGGIWGGILADKYGKSKVFGISLVFYSITFFGFGTASLFDKSPSLIAYLFCFLNLIGGLFRIWSETLGQAILSDLTHAKQKVEVFSLRYTAMNIGSAIGPALGAFLGFSGAISGFYVTGLMCFAYFAIFMLIRHKIPTAISKDIKHTTLVEIIKVLIKDKALMYFIFGGMFAYLVYVQEETTLGQILMQRFSNTALFATLLVINAITVICLQIPLTNYSMRNKCPLSVMKLGCFFIALGLVGMAFAGMCRAFYLSSEVVFTLGEMLIFPLGSIFIDQIAPAELRGTYFGATGFQYLGRFVGPVLGGYMLQITNSKFVLSLFAILSLVTILFYHKGCKNTSIDKSV